MRLLGLDIGRRRIGLAITDASGTLARPLKTIDVGSGSAIDLVIGEIDRAAAEEAGLGQIVVGVPRHLDGSPSPQTLEVEGFVARLRERVALPVDTEDERLSSREAESRLARRERDWRKRKAQLDAAAAAVILQDYVDRHPADQRVTAGGSEQPG